MSERIKVRLKIKPIETYLVKNNMSLRQFSHKLGYDSVQVSNWFTHRRFISARARQKIQDFMKMEWDDLFEIVEDHALWEEEQRNI